MYPGNWKTISPPTAKPVELSDFKRQIRMELDEQTEDTDLLLKLDAATSLVEELQGRQLCQATVAMVLDCFPCSDEITLPRPPLQSVSSITYVDNDGTTQTLATSVYSADTYREPGRVRLKYNQSWPAARTQPDSVTITYVAGYSSAALIPSTTKSAVLLYAAHLYGNREPVSDRPMSEVPLTIERLINIQAVPEVV